jgi:hypothetical protein
MVWTTKVGAEADARPKSEKKWTLIQIILWTPAGQWMRPVGLHPLSPITISLEEKMGRASEALDPARRVTLTVFLFSDSKADSDMGNEKKKKKDSDSMALLLRGTGWIIEY